MKETEAQERRSGGGPSVIRAMTYDDLGPLKKIIDATGLFPSPMLNDMTSGYFSGESPEDVWLTFDEGGPIAVAYYAPERMTTGTWNVYLIAVAPDHQGQGRGAALMRHVERSLAARGARILLVETSGLPEFKRTRAFYAKIGYDEEARIREFYQAGEDKIVFRKSLLGVDTENE